MLNSLNIFKTLPLRSYLIITISTIIFIFLSFLIFEKIKEEAIKLGTQNNEIIARSIAKHTKDYLDNKISILKIANSSRRKIGMTDILQEILEMEPSFKSLYLQFDGADGIMLSRDGVHSKNFYPTKWFEKSADKLLPNITIDDDNEEILYLSIPLFASVNNNISDILKEGKTIETNILEGDGDGLVFVGVIAGSIEISHWIDSLKGILPPNVSVLLNLDGKEYKLISEIVDDDPYMSYIFNHIFSYIYFNIKDNFKIPLNDGGTVLDILLDNSTEANLLNRMLLSECVLLILFIALVFIANFMHKLYNDQVKRRLQNTNKLKDMWLESNKQGIILLDENDRFTFKNHIASTLMDLLNIKDVTELIKSSFIDFNDKNYAIKRIPLYKDDKFEGGIITIEDITEIKELERQKKENEYISIHQSKMIEIGELIGGINHQLKQPINGLNILTDNLIQFEQRNMLTNDILKENLTYFKRNINLLDEIINLYSSYYKTELKLEQCDLYECVNNIIAILKMQQIVGQQFKQRAVILGRGPLRVHSYKNIINQMLLIVIQNAFDASKGTDIYIEINRVGGDAIINIIDYGAGFSDEILKSIFKEIKTSKDKGNGLGLYFAKKLIMKKLGGDIFISNPKSPTVVTLKIPLDVEGNVIDYDKSHERINENNDDMHDEPS